MPNYYIIAAGANPAVLDPGNVNGYPQINAGQITAQPGDAFTVGAGVNSGFNIIPATAGAQTPITLNFDASNTGIAGNLVNAAGIGFQSGIELTVNVAPNVDIEVFNINAGATRSTDFNIGDGARVGNIASSNFNDTITAGDNVTFNGINTIASDDATVTVGDNVRFNGNVNMEATNSFQVLQTGANASFGGQIEMSSSGTSYTIDLGPNSNVWGNINMGGSSIVGNITLGTGTTIGSSGNGNINVGGSNNLFCFAFGDDVTVNGGIAMGGSTNTQMIKVGDDFTLRGDLAMGGANNINGVWIGDNFTMTGVWTGSGGGVAGRGTEYIVVGDNWDMGPVMNLGPGRNDLTLGAPRNGTFTAISGGNEFPDGINLKPPVGQEAAFAAAASAAGWTQNGDGSWSQTNGAQQFTFQNTQINFFERPVNTANVPDCSMCDNIRFPDGIVDGTAGDDLMPILFTDAQGDQIDGADGVNDSIRGNAGNDVIDAGAGNDTVDGGADNDTVTGGAGNDSLDGGAGNDSLNGGADNDTVNGGTGNDTVIGGAGNDTVAGGDGDDTLDGGADDDLLSGGTGNDSLAGGAGNDTLQGDDGADTLNGGAGNDSLAGGGQDDTFVIDPAFGNDTVTGGETGETVGDTLDARPLAEDVTVTLTGPEAGTLTGPSGTVTFSEIENILLGAGDDTVTGGAGNDSVDAGAGDDALTGGAGNDTLAGGDGNDSLAGGTGNDALTGGAGNDTLNGGAGNDALNGGGQDDTFVIDPTYGNDTITGGETGEVVGDTIDARPLAENVTVTLTAPETGTLTGPGGTVTFSEIENILLGSGNDTVTGSSGNDTVDAGGGNDTVDGGAGNDSLDGGDGNDTIGGGTGNDTLDGGAGNDSLGGGEGNDSITGGDGSDTLVGGPGSDTLDGGANDDDFILAAGDTASGGDGDDEFTFDPTQNVAGNITVTGGEAAEEFAVDPTNNPANRVGDVLDLRGLNNVSVTLNPADSESGTATYTTANGQVVTIAFSQIETILTTPVPDGVVDGTANGDNMGIGFVDPQGDEIDGADGLDDTILAGGGNDTVNAGQGDDTVSGGAGNDSIIAGPGNDDVVGGTGNDTVQGGDGNDLLEGNAGQDQLFGGADNDTLLGGGENDTLFGGQNDDSVVGDTGNDSLEGNEGNDTLFGGANEDTLQGNAGNDVLNGDGGNDSLVGGDGSDLANGGDGDDFINTRATAATPDNAGALSDADPNDDRDTVSGGFGNDTILTGDDADVISGDAGNDSIDGGLDNDTIDGGTGNDTILGDEGRDSILGSVGDDLIYGGIAGASPIDIINAGGADQLPSNNADSLFGGDGNDTIFGFDDNDSLVGDAGSDVLDGGIDDDTLQAGDGNDSLIGGQGNDSLLGDQGRDTLEGGLGNDTLTGGADADRFVAQGTDTITDFDAVTGIQGTNNAATDDNDFVDLSGFYNQANLDIWNQNNPNSQFNNALEWLKADQADGVLQNADGLRIQNAGVAVNGDLLSRENTGVVCFTRGTLILTAEGERDIATLSVGDLVYTADHGFQPIRWIGSTTVRAEGRLAPIAIEAGVLGNRRRLKVSPQHRMLLSGWQAELLYDEAEVLVAAKMLVNDSTIRPEESGEVEYFHMLFDEHEIVFAEGSPSESFHPGHQGWGALAEEAREEILALFPMLESGDFGSYGPSARRSLTAYEARVLAGALFDGSEGMANEAAE